MPDGTTYGITYESTPGPKCTAAELESIKGARISTKAKNYQENFDAHRKVTRRLCRLCSGFLRWKEMKLIAICALLLFAVPRIQSQLSAPTFYIAGNTRNCTHDGLI